MSWLMMRVGGGAAIEMMAERSSAGRCKDSVIDSDVCTGRVCEPLTH